LFYHIIYWLWLEIELQQHCCLNWPSSLLLYVSLYFFTFCCILWSYYMTPLVAIIIIRNIQLQHCFYFFFSVPLVLVHVVKKRYKWANKFCWHSAKCDLVFKAVSLRNIRIIKKAKDLMLQIDRYLHMWWRNAAINIMFCLSHSIDSSFVFIQCLRFGFIDFFLSSFAVTQYQNLSVWGNSPFYIYFPISLNNYLIWRLFKVIPDTTSSIIDLEISKNIFNFNTTLVSFQQMSPLNHKYTVAFNYWTIVPFNYDHSK